MRLAGVGALAALVMACGRSDPPKLEVRALPAVAAANGNAARFQLKNVGGQTLTFDGVVPACGCTGVSSLADTLAPGAATPLDVRCDPPREPGTIIRELRVRSNDPTGPETPLRVTLAGPAAGPQPAALYFGYVAVGESEMRDVVLPLGSGPVAPPPRPDLAVEPLPVRPDGAVGIRLRFTPRAAGIVRTSLDLGPNGGALPVTAIGYDRLMAFPPEVRLPRPTGASGLPSITLVGRGAAPLAIADVDYPSGVSGELRTIVPGKQFRLVLRGRPATTANAAIRILGAAGDELLVIPVGGAVRPTT